jgi:large subunit ribosomal protein L37Ae
LPRMRKTGLGGGLATRYGTAPRRRYIEILTRMRRSHECPRCQIRSAKRLSVGIWECRRCGYQFTGGAYTPFTKVGDVAARAATGKIYSPLGSRPPAESAAAEGVEAETGKPKRKSRRKKTTELSKEETQ